MVSVIGRYGGRQLELIIPKSVAYKNCLDSRQDTTFLEDSMPYKEIILRLKKYAPELARRCQDIPKKEVDDFNYNRRESLSIGEPSIPENTPIGLLPPELIGQLNESFLILGLFETNGEKYRMKVELFAEPVIK
jgi:hypothetical protein